MLEYHKFIPKKTGEIECYVNSEKTDFFLQKFKDLNLYEKESSIISEEINESDDFEETDFEGNNLEENEKRPKKILCLNCKKYGNEKNLKQCSECNLWFHNNEECMFNDNLCYLCKKLLDNK